MTTLYYPTIDSFMDQYNADVNYGSENQLGVQVLYFGGNKTDGPDRAILNFDVTGLTVGDVGAVSLFVLPSNCAPSAAAHIYRCTRPSTWTEAGVTWNKYDGTNWTAGGGDYDASTPTPVAFNTSTQTGVWFEIPGLKDFVTDAITRSNIVSIIMRLDAETPSSSFGFWFCSSEHSQANWPYLSVAAAAGGDRRRIAIC
jgi:hypothetical protein